MLQHVLLLTKTKGSYACARAPNNCMGCGYSYSLKYTGLYMRIFKMFNCLICLLDKSTCINCYVCELKKPKPSDSRSQLQVTCKVTL